MIKPFDPFNQHTDMASSVSITPILPELPKFPEPDMSQLNPASWAYERIARQIQTFEDELSSDEEIGLRLVATPDSIMHVDDVGYHGPDMLIFYGTNEHGRAMRLLQHMTQLNVLLTAVPKKQETAQRIGFHLVAKISEPEREPAAEQS